MIKRRSTSCILLLILVGITARNLVEGRAFHRTSILSSSSLLSSKSNVLQQLFDIRGGATSKSRRKGGKVASLSSKSSKSLKSKKKKEAAAAAKKDKTLVDGAMEKYKSILPLTRIYISAVGIVTAIGLVLGEEATQAIFALDPIRTIYGAELWRPFTAATYLGTPSINWLFSGYYLLNYGTSLEGAFGTAQFLVFLSVVITLLTCASMLLRQPFYTQAVITSMLHVLSRAMPHQMVGWLVFKVPYWALPLGFMTSDVLQAQGSIAAAIPHILGILVGHFYFFHKNIWPKLEGGQDWLDAPDFLVRRLDPNSALANDDAVKQVKGRKKGKSKKLGGTKA